ncbi:MAG: hypothetical protein GX992_00430 [Clostridium sp.]|nr:hypothetical protein [Clostridium sp.]
MEKYLLRVELLTDAVFGSGSSETGFIDAGVLHDKYGFVYINAKTLKGKLGEMASVFVNMLKKMDGCEGLAKVFHKKKEELFGIPGEYDHNRLKFSDCEIKKDIRKYYKSFMKDSKINPQEILESLTYIQTQTSIDYNTGVAKRNSLRNLRVINRGLVLYSSIYSPQRLDDDAKILLSSACSFLRHLGSNETKGKGRVRTKLLSEGKDISKEYIKLLGKKVGAGV